MKGCIHLNGRVSAVGNLSILRAGNPAVVEIGDSKHLTPSSYVMAVQREQAIFIENEFNFRDYRIFLRPQLQPIVNENLKIATKQEALEIRVGKIDIFSVSSASIVHIGSSERLRSETRIKHIRHLLREKPQEYE
jgi:spore germination protein PE